MNGIGWQIVVAIAGVALLFCLTGYDSHKSESGSSDATENLQPESDISSTTENQVEIDPDTSSSTESTPIPEPSGDISGVQYTTEGGNPFAVLNLNQTNNCTLYAWGRAFEITGKPLGISGKPYEWIDQASANWKVGKTIKARSIAVFKNHVLIVESISWDGKITVTEGGSPYYGYSPHVYVSVEQLESSYGSELLGYIYLE